jgi:flavin-binding protein dodecin
VGGRQRAFVAEVEDLLAKAGRVSELRPDQIKAVAERHGVDLASCARTQKRNFYRRLLEFCLADHALSDEESADLAHLREVLVLPDDEVATIHDDVARVFYGQAMDQVLADYRLDPEEERFLERLRAELGIGEDVAHRLEEEGTRRARQRFLSRSLASNSAVVASQDTRIELVGRSESGLEDAIRGALDEACRAAPDLRSARVTDIRVELREGGIRAWLVKVEARL